MTSPADTISLSRTVRLFLAPGEPVPPPATNSFAAISTTPGLGAFYEIILHCSGVPAERTGFVENIYEMDRAVQAILAPRIAQALHAGNVHPAALLQASMKELSQYLYARMTRVDWNLSPTYRVSMEPMDMTT
ncbi:MAG: hypothetical protein VX527_03045, partial [Planctomycetota bacterium]|nr:hypothetical protein [Planctomycetota bacterium]